MAILTGPLPTPGVAFVIQSMRADAGVMISASHNPYYDNGIKIFDHTGHKLPDEIELELESFIFNQDKIETQTDEKLGKAKRLDEVFGRYIVQTKSSFPGEYSLDGMRIVLDCANGAGYKVAPMIFQELGAEVIPIGVSPDGVNINHKCGALHPDNCAEMVLKYRADIGICLDGDADRLVVIDHEGGVVPGDQLLGILALFLKQIDELDDDSQVVGTVMSNMGLENFLEQNEINLLRTQVGDRYIVEAMKKSGAVFGGEPSGHIIFKKYSTTGDGILSALKVLECMKYYQENLKDLYQNVPLYPQVNKNIPVAKKIPFEQLPDVQTKLEEVNERLSKEGRVLLRYSGTEKLARVMVEGKNQSLLEEVSDQLADVIRKNLS
jgi:phosphoglucosamine mutase